VRPVPDANDPQRCDFCKGGHVTRNDQQMGFRQWNDRGYVSCRVTIPLGVCEHWNEDAEAIVEDVVGREYEELLFAA
jgi:hypothetical protein